jgi:hypothetical protein
MSSDSPGAEPEGVAPNRIEREILDRFGEGDTERIALLRDQLRAAIVSEREESTAGFHLTLTVPPEVARLPGGVSVALDDVLLASPRIPSGVGFLLWIGNGRPYRLEGFTYGDAWLPDLAEYTVTFANGHRNQARIDDMLAPKPIQL